MPTAPDSVSVHSHSEDNDSSIGPQQWPELVMQLNDRSSQPSANQTFGAAAVDGNVFRWGIAVATGGPCSSLVQVLSRVACFEAELADPLNTKPLSEKKTSAGKKTPRTKAVSTADKIVTLEQQFSIDVETAAALFIDVGPTSTLTVVEAAEAVLWAAALPALANRLPMGQWWDLLGHLQAIRDVTAQRCEPHDTLALIVGAELGLTLAWSTSELPSCSRMGRPAARQLSRWIDGAQESLSAAISPVTQVRLVAASLYRCNTLASHVTGKKPKKVNLAFATELATWVAAATTCHQTSAFSSATPDDAVDDNDGLLSHITDWDPDSLVPAISAALGQPHQGGRLVWESSLPETFHHNDVAKVAVILPAWDVRRGRTHLTYDNEDIAIEMFAGKTQVFSGKWQVFIEVDGDQQHADGPWSYTCEYTDDEVHYLEFEQPWSGGVILQRQVMILRDDRSVLLADAVLPTEGTDTDGPKAIGEIRYTSRIPLAAHVVLDEEAETRELFIAKRRVEHAALKPSSASAKRIGTVFPLAASEWKVGPTAAKLEPSEDQRLVHSVKGNGRLFAPIWMDLQTRRSKRKRTWRQLTVTEDLRIVGANEAVGYRIQVGSEQWLFYRSLCESRLRSVLGKHLIADFFCGRFDPGDGDIDDLITVDDRDDEE